MITAVARSRNRFLINITPSSVPRQGRTFDDQELIRTGLELVLGGRGVEVRGQAGNGREAIELTRKLDPDVVVLMDIRMPVLDGVAATRDLTKVGVRARVLILSTYGADRFVYEALRAGAAGFVLKTTPPGQLVTRD